MGPALCYSIRFVYASITKSWFSRCKSLTEAGAKQGLTPADVVQQCDIIFSCVSDSDAVRDVSLIVLAF